MTARILPLILLTLVGTACKQAPKFRETQDPPKALTTPIHGAYRILVPARPCWDVRSQEVGTNRAHVQVGTGCSNTNYNVFQIRLETNGWYTITTAFATNSWVNGPGQPGEQLFATSASDPPDATKFWTFDEIERQGDRITTYIRSKLQVEQDGVWKGLCADRATNDYSKIQSMFCNGTVNQIFFLVPVGQPQ